MSLLKRILIVVGIIIAIPLLLALFVKKEYSVEREIVINKPQDEVFEYVKYLKNQNDYSKWASIDPNMKKEFRGVDGTVGFVSAWESEDPNVGKGEQEIKDISEGERIEYELRFIEPFESTSSAYLITDSLNENQTTVKWGFNGKMDYPMNLMTLFMDMEDMIGSDLDIGLQNLKKILENER